MDTCSMTSLSLTIFHCLIQFPQRRSHQAAAFNSVAKTEDQLGRWNRADSSGSTDEKARRGRESIGISRRGIAEPGHRCAPTPLVSCRAAYLMRAHCASLCMPYWTEAIGNQVEIKYSLGHVSLEATDRPLVRATGTRWSSWLTWKAAKRFGSGWGYLDSGRVYTAVWNDCELFFLFFFTTVIKSLVTHTVTATWQRFAAAATAHVLW